MEGQPHLTLTLWCHLLLECQHDIQKRKKPASQYVDDTLKMTCEVEFGLFFFFQNILKGSHFPFMSCRAMLLSCRNFEQV